MSNSVSSSSFRISNLLSKASKWSFDFDFLDGFWRSKFGWTTIALNATSTESCIHELISRVEKINQLDLLDENKKTKNYFSKKLLYHRLHLTSSENGASLYFPHSNLEVICCWLSSTNVASTSEVVSTSSSRVG